MRCAPPTASSFHFEGVAEIDCTGEDVEKEMIDLSLDNFLPRGAILRSSGAGVVVLVIYTGMETKLVLN